MTNDGPSLRCSVDEVLDQAGVPATIYERGNGLPDVGDYVAGDDGEVYRVVSLDGRIQTAQTGSGRGNSISAIVALADWADVDDDTEPTCSAVLSGEDGEDER